MPRPQPAPTIQFQHDIHPLRQAIQCCWRDVDRQLRMLSDVTGRLTSAHDSLRDVLAEVHDALYALRTHHARALDAQLAQLQATGCSESFAAVSACDSERTDVTGR